MSTSVRIFIPILFSTLLTAVGCGPVYETQYTLTPPESAEGRACTFQCENSKSQCEQLEEIKQERCEERAQLERERCEWDFRRRGKEPKWYDCGGSSCSSETERCETQYRRCFELCGGKVTATNVCVYGCQQ